MVKRIKGGNDWQIQCGENNSNSAAIIRWRADFLLAPAVVPCYFKNTWKNSISEQSKWTTEWHQEVSHYTEYQTEDHYFFVVTCDLALYNSWQKMKTEKKGMKGGGESPVSRSFCDLLDCLRSFVSFFSYRHRRVLFWSRLWPLLCQLCRQFPVPLS